MKMIRFLKKELNNFKEEISDNPWAFYVIMFMMVPTVLVSIACFFDDPWTFCVIMFMIAFIVLLTIVCYFNSMEQERQERHKQTTSEYYDSGKVFATDKVTVTDKYFAKTSNGKDVQKCLTVKFDGRSYYISDSKRKAEKSREKADE